MKVAFRQSFVRDLKKIHDRDILRRVQQVIEQIETVVSLEEITNIRKISTKGEYFRVRIGDFRIGLFLHQEKVDIVRCLHRRDLYRYFP